VSTVLHVVTLVALCVSVIFSTLTVANIRTRNYYERLARMAAREDWYAWNRAMAHPPVWCRLFDAQEYVARTCRRWLHR